MHFYSQLRRSRQLLSIPNLTAVSCAYRTPEALCMWWWKRLGPCATTHRATEFTPFELLFGYNALLLSCLQQKRTTRCNYNDCNRTKEPFEQVAHEIARDLLSGSTTGSNVTHKKTVKVQLSLGMWPEYTTGTVKGTVFTKDHQKRRRNLKVHVNELKPFFRSSKESCVQNFKKRVRDSRQQVENGSS